MTSKPPDDQRLRKFFTAWWFAALMLLLWLALAFSLRPTTQLSLPYSSFLAQLHGGNVASVAIAGDQISGTLRQAIADADAQPPAPQTLYSAFTTTFPTSVGDRSLLPLLISEHVRIEATSSASSWFVQLLLQAAPVLLLVGLIVWMNRGAAVNSAGQFGRSSPQRYRSDQPPVTFADVAAADDAKAELQEEIDFLVHPEKYHRLGATIPRGILLVGSPGTGKTLLARAVAGEARVPFFSLNASEFVEMFVGVGASRVRDLFRQAKEAAPAIVFIDELDAVGRRRGAGIGNTNDEREQTLNQLLGELDGFDNHSDVIILAATNRPDVLDPALLRPGRFDRQVVIELPERDGREAILRVHVRPLPLGADVDLPGIAAETTGFSGADLANLCNEAALSAARHEREFVTMADFDEAHDKVRLGAAHAALRDSAERRTVAYHEAGHTVVAWMIAGADPVRKVTILPRGQALGRTEQLPEVERRNLGAAYLRNRLAVMMGGHAAETLVLGDTTTGVQNDLIEATRLARRMVTQWGMGELGAVAFANDEEQPFLGYELTQGARDYGEATAARIDRSVTDLLAAAETQATTILCDERVRLDALAAALLKEETVDTSALAQILGPRPVAVTPSTQPSHTLHAELAH
ncbi:MAG: ATP-dependent zinc metalloprotease FtsH [Candidatus Lustribacter sp.]|jgi:cell division protease FtsH